MRIENFLSGSFTVADELRAVEISEVSEILTHLEQLKETIRRSLEGETVADSPLSEYPTVEKYDGALQKLIDRYYEQCTDTAPKNLSVPFYEDLNELWVLIKLLNSMKSGVSTRAELFGVDSNV